MREKEVKRFKILMINWILVEEFWEIEGISDWSLIEMLFQMLNDIL